MNLNVHHGTFRECIFCEREFRRDERNYIFDFKGRGYYACVECYHVTVKRCLKERNEEKSQ